ncbi:MAG: hypothetical protein U0326_03930 [Polyangiales bacterium]
MSAMIGCVPTPYTMQASLEAGDVFLTPETFTADRYYDERGATRLLPVAPSGRRAALRSYRFVDDHPLRDRLERRTFVYDLALAMIVHTLADREPDARAIGRTLCQLVDASGGAPGFSLGLDAPAFYDVEYVRSGVVAWVGYALALHDLVKGENRFRAHARRVADALLSSRFPSGSDPRAGLILAGRGRWLDGQRRFDGPWRADYCVTEHQIDAWFLLDALGRLGEARYQAEADALSSAMLSSLWLADEGRFAVAATANGLDRALALDAAGAWGALFLLARGEREKASASLRFTERTFATRVDDLDGFAPYAGTIHEYEGYDFSSTLFAEGTAAVGLARLRMGDRVGAERVAEVLRRLQRRGDGGVLYATPEGPDMPQVPAAAPTAWLLLLERELAGQRAAVFAPRVSAP